MIKFFRAIRQNLLKEGKTANYLKYAIGEIVLVMIGILLALQVDNWNQNRLEKLKEKKILVELKRDLASNDTILQREIENQQIIIEEITKTMEHLKMKKPFNDTIGVYLGRISWIERIQFVSSAYESLKSIGIDIISSDPLRSDIANLFGNSFPFTTNWLRDAGLAHSDQLLPFYTQFFEVDIKPFQVNSEPNIGNLFQDLRLAPYYDDLLQSREFVNAISKKRGFKLTIAEYLKRLQNSVRKTISDIDNELETFD